MAYQVLSPPLGPRQPEVRHKSLRIVATNSFVDFLLLIMTAITCAEILSGVEVTTFAICGPVELQSRIAETTIFKKFQALGVGQ